MALPGLIHSAPGLLDTCAPSAARRRHNVGPRRRDPVCHPDSLQEGAAGGRAARGPGGPPPAPRPPLPSLRLRRTSHLWTPPRCGRDALRCHRAGSLPRAPRRPPAHPWAAPRSRRPFAQGSGAAPFPGRGRSGTLRPAQLARRVPEHAGAPPQVPLRPLIRGRYPGGGAKPLDPLEHVRRR